MILDCFSRSNDWGQPGARCPEVPLLQESLALFGGRLAEEFLECQADLIGPGGLEVLPREIENTSALRPGQAARVCQPQKSGLFQGFTGENLLSSNLVHRVVHDFGQMEPVEGNLGIGEMVIDPFDKGCGHVTGYSLDLGGGSFVGLKVLGKFFNGGSVFSGSAEHHALSLKVEEESHIPMSSPARGFVHPDSFHIREIPRRHSAFYIVMKHPPNLGVVLADEISHGQYWHFLAKSHHQRIEQQGKPGAWSCPRNRGFANGVALVAINTRDSGVQERRMLKEVQVPPAIFRSVVGLAKSPTGGTRQETPSFEINVNVQPFLRCREEDLFNLPRQLQPQSCSKKFLLSHFPPDPIFTTCTGQAIVNAQINKIFLDVLNPGSWKSA